MKANKQEQISRQIAAITRVFGALNVETQTAWRIFRRAEKKMRRASEMYMSFADYGREHLNVVQRSVSRSVLGCFADPSKIGRALVVNTDPRGYALKINGEFARNSGIYTDFGGEMVLAPEY